MRGVRTQRANKSKVTFNEKDEVKEYDPADPACEKVKLKVEILDFLSRAFFFPVSCYLRLPDTQSICEGAKS